MHLQENISLAPYTTLGVGGPARYFVRATQEAELLEALSFAREHGVAVFVLGGGSNLLVADAGFAGLVLQVALGGEVETALDPRGTRVDVHVPAGMDWDAFVLFTCERGFSGVECLAGIPGLVGGSPVQNIGAYGQEVAQTVASVRVLDIETLKFHDLEAAQCGFAYRTSIFNTTQSGRFIVTRVSFQFALDATPQLNYADLKAHFADKPNPTPLEIYEAVRAIRLDKGMLLVPGDPGPDGRSAGSFFKNPIVSEDFLPGLAEYSKVAVEKIPQYPPGAKYAAADRMVKLSAAWLMEQVGFRRGYGRGRAGISSKHVLALVNRGGATAAEIVDLRDTVIDHVAGSTGIELEQEPVSVGFPAV